MISVRIFAAIVAIAGALIQFSTTAHAQAPNCTINGGMVNPINFDFQVRVPPNGFCTWRMITPPWGTMTGIAWSREQPAKPPCGKENTPHGEWGWDYRAGSNLCAETLLYQIITSDGNETRVIVLRFAIAVE